MHSILKRSILFLLLDCSARKLRLNIQECLLFIKVLSDLVPQSPQQSFSRIGHLLLLPLDPREQARLLGLIILGTKLAQLPAGFFQLRMVLHLCPLLLS
jgi:hypothetical protein